MLAQEARAIARQWVADHAAAIPGFRGAFYHGSIGWLADDATVAPTSDLDLMIVLDDPDPPVKPGKFVHRGVLLEVSYVAGDQLRSAEQVLGQADYAGSFRVPSVIADPTGHLNALQAAVARDFAKRRWVVRRCEHAQTKILNNFRALRAATTEPDQVICWLFGTGVTTHLPLIAGLENPTVRRRYAAVRALLADYGHGDFHETLLDLLGCATMTPERATAHLAALTEVFDATIGYVKTSFPFASDLSAQARPIAIDGSRDLIARGEHREAAFWLAVTYARCQRALLADAPPALHDRYGDGYRRLLADLGIATQADRLRRAEQVEQFLPELWRVTEAIVAANDAIED